MVSEAERKSRIKNIPKKCEQCGKIFYRDSRHVKQSQFCSDLCQKRAWYEGGTTKENVSIKLQKKRYYEDNKKKLLGGMKDYYAENEAKIKKQRKDYQKLYAREQYAKNRVKILAKLRAKTQEKNK